MISYFAMRSFYHFIATGAYSGLSPISPGTFGSIAALAAWLSFGSNLTFRVYALIILLALSLISVSSLVKTSVDKDPQYIVIDEWVGMWIALLPLSIDESSSYIHLACAFTLFRIFDILKPWPVSWCESYPGATGVILDDIAAGALAALIFIVL